MAANDILVIKHGALGDIILATGAFAAIRAQHQQAHITLLTTKPYAELLGQSPYFNDIWVDEKPRPLQLGKLWRLRRRLNSRPWSWVYDLQTSRRSTSYHRLFAAPKPNISGVGSGDSHAYADPLRKTIHAFEALKNQLSIAGVTMGDVPDIRWLKADISDFNLPQRFALLVPGGAAHRPEKRWPAEHYASIASALVRDGITPVLIGGAAEAEVLDTIAAQVPEAMHLGGKTTIPQLAELARGAALAVGNDTGPMHVIAATNCPSTVLFSAASNPVRSRPIGRYVTVMQKANLQDLSPERVLASLTV